MIDKEFKLIPIEADERDKRTKPFVLTTGLDAEEMPNEKVLSSPTTVAASNPVATTGDNEEVEILVSFDQSVDDLHG